MTQEYKRVWHAIKTNDVAEITVHEALAPTIIQGVKKAKSAENMARKLGGLVRYSKLKIEKERLDARGMLKVTFRLVYSMKL